MHSIRTRFTLLTVSIVLITLCIAAFIGVFSIRSLGSSDAEQMLHLAAASGAMHLEAYIESVEHSVDTVSSLVQDSFQDMSMDQLEGQVERSRNLFSSVAYNTNGVLTYYFRIDPEVSDTVKGFWYVRGADEEFQEHEVTDITQYDTSDTSALVWFTVPKATGEGLWLPPYYTENLNAKVISYNAPVYWQDRFVGVIGIEIDYEMLSQEVSSISVFESGYAFILDADNNVICHPQMEAETLNIEPAAVHDTLTDETGDHIHYSYGGEEKEAVWVPLSNGMRLFVTAPVEEIDSRWKGAIWSQMSALCLLLALTCVAACVFYLWTDKTVTGPIRLLAVKVEEFTRRYRERREPESLTIDVSQIRSRNEIGSLAGAVSEMGDTIREYAQNAARTERELQNIKANVLELSEDLDALTRKYAGNAAPRPAGEHHSYDIQELGKQIDGLKNNIRDYITHTNTQANSMITAMAADYRSVYYVNLDQDDAVCYREDPTDADQIPAGVHFPYLERMQWYAQHCVAEQYRSGFEDFVCPEHIRQRLAQEAIIAYRYLAVREGREYYEMIRMAGVRRASERDDHTVHAVGMGLTEIDGEMRESMARNEALAAALAVAEEASSAKTAFLSNMSHEIRTPMNAIIGLDAMALHDESLSAQTRTYLEKIGASARHLLALINDILSMSRIESGRIVLNRGEFSFAAMLEQINTMVTAQCSEKGLHYACRMLSPVDEYYIGDDTRLKEVLVNILSNAVKFTDAPGNVTLTVERTAVFEGQSSLRFCIRDTGIGMDKAFLPKIFDAFSQEDSSRKNKYGSTGLGMAITKSIVEMMNGTISVTSEKGVGTEFTVVVTLKNSQHHTTDREDAIDPATLRVLVVDDEEFAAEHAQMVLNEAGIRTDIAMGGEEALRMMEIQRTKQEPYNLVLMDWKMPGLDGVDSARRMRERFSKETTILLLTGYNWDDVVDAARSAGVDSFLSKPLSADSVLTEFRRVARRNNFHLFQEKQRAPLEGRHILLAEDMEINAEIMTDVLEMEGMAVQWAENGKVAVEQFAASAEGGFDAVLMDIRMPEMDGLEAAAAIRAMDRPDARTVPIIALTANAFDEDVQRSLQVGMNAHLSKPVEPELLYQTLGELIWQAEAGGERQ